MSEFISAESGRCLHCKNPSCTVGCPVHYDIPTFLQHCKEGQYDLAVQTVGHLFGEVCGYLCPRNLQCKGHCILNKLDKPIDVGAVERSVFAQNFPKLCVQDYALGHMKIAVIGGGVSGITFAEQCYRHGADVTVYEKNQLLHTLESVPSFRLPKEALQRIVTAIKNSKIKVEHRAVDSAFLQQLQKTHNIVYLATGVTIPYKMNIEGEHYAVTADEFLRGNTFGKIIVVGGGNTAMDCARANVRRGGETVVAYRRTREDMPAFLQEVEEAEKDNVQFCFNLAPISLQKHNGKLFATFAKTLSEGRGKLTVTGQLVTLECDQLVVATGSKFDNSVYAAEKFISVDENNRVCDNLYAGGDAVGKNLVVQAVFDGINAAQAIVKGIKR